MDTCFLIDLMKGDPDAQAVARLPTTLKTTSISSAEFLYGAKQSGKKNMYDFSEKFLRFFPVLPFDEESAVIYAGIAHAFSGTGRHISTFDELIAAIALRHDEPLVTRDRHFSVVEGLEVISY
ncbi:type II toxin-antitoxin system VapC family toxin [Methanoregula sp.]|uniref:type II toxin-antitoxin system VapC family toxin n=1 Tax=Methanoregula sp. TaxID=2052170 RepID=UPI00236FCD96|nr:type II toxin-antitoxin system VapC family toxin [Methanoregula sp.]MDD1687256.1 type II toxin-antitoxin system VapC family toxin [Methanoregula sp.]